MYYTLIVAGGKELALEECERRGLQVSFLRELRNSSRRTDTVLRLEQPLLHALALWYLEDQGKGFPLPPGSLLLYSEHEGKEGGISQRAFA